jgi:hypothetical protein
MTISYTGDFRFRQITYLHDGQEAATAYNESMTKANDLFSYLIVSRLAGNGNIITDRVTGQPIYNRLLITN